MIKFMNELLFIFIIIYIINFIFRWVYNSFIIKNQFIFLFFIAGFWGFGEKMIG